MLKIIAMLAVAGVLALGCWYAIQGGEIPPGVLVAGVSLGLVALFIGVALIFKKAFGMVFNILIVAAGATLLIVSIFAKELGIYDGEGYWWSQFIDGDRSVLDESGNSKDD